VEAASSSSSVLQVSHSASPHSQAVAVVGWAAFSLSRSVVLSHQFAVDVEDRSSVESFFFLKSAFVFFFFDFFFFVTYD
jgi:hypothetical protein